MSIRVAIQSTSERDSTIVEMMRCVRGLEYTQDVSTADGLITDDATLSKLSVGEDQFVLLLSPFLVDEDRLVEINAMCTVVPALRGRSLPSVRKIKQEIDVGNLGLPGLLRLHDWDRSRALDDQRLAEHIDVASWCFGQLPCLVYAISRSDYVQIHLGFEGDGMAIIDIDAGDALGGSYQSLHLIGSRGTAYADDHDNMQLAIDSQGIAAIPTTQRDVAWVNLLQAFCELIRTGDSQQPAWQNVIAINRVVADVHQSFEHQRPVKLEHASG